MSRSFLFVVAVMLVTVVVGFVVFISYQQQKLTKNGFSLSDDRIAFPADEVDITKPFNEPSVDYDPGNSVDVEAYNQLYIKKGSFLSWDNQNKVIELLVGNLGGGNIIARFVAPTNDLAACWPESVPTQSGTTVYLKDAYIPFAPDKGLRWENQRIENWSELITRIDPSTYIIVSLDKAFDEKGLNQVNEMAVLGCL